MDLDASNGLMAATSKVNFKTESCMVMAHTFGKMDESMRVITSSTKSMAREPTPIQTEVSTVASGSTVCSTATVA